MNAMTSTVSDRPPTLTNSYDVSSEGLSTRSLSSFISLLFFLFFFPNFRPRITPAKIGTDLWATEDKGMIRAPDFGRIGATLNLPPTLTLSPNP